MEATLSLDKRSLILNNIFVLWDNQEDLPVIRHMIDPEDQVRKPCIFLFPSAELMRRFKGGIYADEKRYPSLVLDIPKTKHFLGEMARLQIVPLIGFEEEGQLHLRQLTGAYTAIQA